MMILLVQARRYVQKFGMAEFMLQKVESSGGGTIQQLKVKVRIKLAVQTKEVLRKKEMVRLKEAVERNEKGGAAPSYEFSSEEQPIEVGLLQLRHMPEFTDFPEGHVGLDEVQPICVAYQIYYLTFDISPI
ncbi:hypothetical protein NL676_037848 [Syzygium grande]|nr:hypothetical protein NL676_037848 [Syzygium grande]